MFAILQAVRLTGTSDDEAHITLRYCFVAHCEVIPGQNDRVLARGDAQLVVFPDVRHQHRHLAVDSHTYRNKCGENLRERTAHKFGNPNK